MIQNIAGIKTRMRSVNNIRKITRAMEMVSMSKLNRVRSSLFAMRNYFGKLESILSDFLEHTGYVSHPLLEKRASRGKLGLCVITSDTGLCGIYNQAIIRACEAFIEKFQKENIKLVTVGREGHHHFERSGFQIKSSYLELHGRYPEKLSEKIASATKNGCEKNFWIFLARDTISLSSSDNSSRPNMEMISRNSL